VHKFGGTSVADATAIRAAVALVRAAPARTLVVVSALAGVTDDLLDLCRRAASGRGDWKAVADTLVARHRTAAEALLAGGERQAYLERLAASAGELSDGLRAVSLLRSVPDPVRDLVSGYGELWSAPLVAAALRAAGDSAAALDAREVLVVTAGETGPRVDWERSGARLATWLAARPEPRIVATGFVASTPDGAPTTLGRNGSDYSASIFGALLQAQSVTIWTDVDGVLSADPRLVPEALVLDHLSYDEAMELAYFGAKVLHPHTMQPAVQRGIPLWIKNSRNPTAPGTRIGPRIAATAPPSAAEAVRGFSTFSGLALVDVQGSGMIGVPGIAQRLFGALQSVGVSVVMISQASSEHSICVAMPEEQAARARAAIESAFAAELQHGRVQRVAVTTGCTILAAVGDAMAETPGVAARFFAALAKAGVNVRAVAQGASERNITAVVASDDSARALRAVHAGFYLSDQTLSVGVVGPGGVGAAFLAQLAAQQTLLRDRFHIDLRVRGIARAAGMLLEPQSIDLGRWRQALAARILPTDLAAFADHVQADHIPHAVIVDCTASEGVAARYADWLARGIHVVTPNKRANSGPLAAYRRLVALGSRHRTHYFYEATVGAGLPIITTLRDLVQTGDRVRRIEGVLSGTLSWLFNVYDGAVPFSTLVRDARARGFTEPDPRDDLSGMDVARKLVILAREIGLGLELEAIEVESLVPPELAGAASIDEFLSRLPEHDAAMQARLQAAAAAGEVLRYVGVVDPATPRAWVRLERYPRPHPFGGLSATDNLVAFTTDRYAEQPLVVRGPGAGPEVTAAGIFADLLRLAAALGAMPLRPS
jgi:aspartokinase/homoserine dehydrogenase 1